MYKPYRFLTIAFSLFFLILISTNLLTAQVFETTSTTDISVAAEVTKTPDIPGATVRGRVVYDDSSLPFRYGYVGLKKIVEKDDTGYNPVQYAKTDENGEFILRDIKPGNYFPNFESEGLLNPEKIEELNDFNSDSPKPEEIFQKIRINGQGEIQVFIRALRGSAINGIVRYSDGEPVSGAKVEVLSKLGDKFYAYPIENAKTDDRGFYRFAGMPEGVYTVRVIEPVSHKIVNESSYELNASERYSYGKELLKTYYPNVETAAEAGEFELLTGQEQKGVNVTLVKYSLFDISGDVILKRTGEPLKNFEVTFIPLERKIDEGITYKKNITQVPTMGGVKVGVGIGSGSSSAVSDEKPSDWMFRSLPRGKYLIRAKQSIPYKDRNKNITEYPDASKEIEIIGGDISDILIEIQESLLITGIVVDKDGKVLPDGIGFYVWGENGKPSIKLDYSQYRKSNPAPRKQIPFKVSKLIAGKLRIDTYSDDFYVKDIVAGNKKVENGMFELNDNENLSNVRIIVGFDVATLNGKVSGTGNSNQVAVYLMKSKSGDEDDFVNYVGDIIDKDGNFEVKVPPGTYRIVVIDQAKVSISSNDDKYEKVRNELAKNAQTVTLKPNQKIKLNLIMPEQPEIKN